ncbi:RNA-directed DNA polymerase, eukaryota [Tanacetum coccineum]
MAPVDSMHSNASLLERLSCNIFITNFPPTLSAKDFWSTCSQYGTVLDVYIPLKVTKNGKRFAFARFTTVNDVDLLIRNLRSVWLGSFHLFANVARFNRDTNAGTAQKASTFNPSLAKPSNGSKPSFATILKDPTARKGPDAPVLVLERGVLNFEGDSVLVGCVKEFKSLPNIHIACFNEGFPGLKISYLGGFWILLEFDSSQSCEKFKLHEGIKSWFSSLLKWTPNFEIKDRVVWIDIEGIPLRAWSHTNFEKIARKWGELVHLDNSNVPNKYSMRICVKTNVQHIIVESFKVILEGKVSIVRAKEVTGWAPDFSDDNSSISDDVSVKYSEATHNWVDENDVEVVEDSFQRQVNDTAREGNNNVDPYKDNIWAEPWDIVPYLSRDSFLSLSHKEASNNVFDKGNNVSKSFNNSHNGSKQDYADSTVRGSNPANGFSILERFQEFINIGQAMGYDMKGTFWGNMSFDYATSSARGRSGGILCVWDNTLFKKRSVKVTEHCLCVEVVVMGDFNEVRYASERYGSVFHAANAVEFNDFIVNSHLHEIPLDSENLDDMNKKDSIDLAQKAKVKWAIVGDENSKFFHGIVNKKRRYLAIKGILKDGEWINNPTRVKAEFSHHFSNRFSQPDWIRVPLAEHFPRCLSEDLSCDLEVEVNSDEINKAVWECGSDKSPGLDDFTFEFFKKYWSIVGNDVILSVKEFFSSGFIPNGCNPSFIALIPKQSRTSAFVKGRQIMDGPIILNEVISWCKSKKEQSLLFKIKGCLSSSKASVLVNGSPTDEFTFHRGLRQGDPLSPFLFILVMESLHVSFQRLIDRGMFTPITVGDNNQVPISHLFYADDAMFIGKWTCENVNALMLMLHCFFLASGLKINVQKSSISSIRVRPSNVRNMAAIFGCTATTLPFTYLGVNVGANMKRISSWDVVVNKVTSKLSTWKAKTLSVRGRLTLIKSVLSAIPSYYMSLFKDPEGVLKRLESIRNSFFLGADLGEKKVTWSNHSGLWVNVIKAIHGNDGSLNTVTSNHGYLVWSGIIQASDKLKSKGIDLFSFCKLVVGNGHSIKFWQDKWYGEVPFKDKFKRCFNLELQKDIYVALKLQSNDIALSFRRSPRSSIEESQFGELNNLLTSVVLSNAMDRWSYCLCGHGNYSVKSAREYIDQQVLISSSTPTRWSKVIPIKLNIFMWRLALDKLPTRNNLAKRGIIAPCLLCPICHMDIESRDHLFFRCPMALDLIRLFSRWWSLQIPSLLDYTACEAWIAGLRHL